MVRLAWQNCQPFILPEPPSKFVTAMLHSYIIDSGTYSMLHAHCCMLTPQWNVDTYLLEMSTVFVEEYHWIKRQIKGKGAVDESSSKQQIRYSLI